MIEPVKISLTPGSDAERRMKSFLRDNIRSLKAGLKELHEVRYPSWRKAYEAVPAEKVREFPFHNASNVIVPIIAIHSDTLLARVMAAVLKTRPLWVTKLVGEHPAGTENFRTDLETALEYAALEPEILDIYRVYHQWFGEGIRYGTSIVKGNMEQQVEDEVIPAGDGTGKYDFSRVVKYEGPRIAKLPFPSFYISPTAQTIEDAEFKAHRVVLRRFQLEERSFRHIYDQTAVKSLLSQPDRTTSDSVGQQAQNDAGARVVGGYGYAEWDVFECHFRYRFMNKYVRCLVWYHEKSDQILRAFFDYYPCEQFVACRMFYRDDMFHGYGFAETLAQFQEEISTIHNQRRDNSTVSNMAAWRVDPESKLHKGYTIFPSAMLPAKAGEIEPLSLGQPYNQQVDEERLSLELAEKRSGVSSPMQGMGSGVMNKRGVYTAMGTLSLLQEGNTRTDLNITDIRYAHTKVGRLITKFYAEFGIGDLASKFGIMGPRLDQALQLAKRGSIALPVYASSASVNREVEKQNDMLLANVMMRLYNSNIQLIQALSNPMIPPETKQYIFQSIEATNYLHKQVLKHFGYDEVDKMVPAVQPPQSEGGQAPPQNGGGQPPDQAQLLAAMAAQNGGGV